MHTQFESEHFHIQHHPHNRNTIYPEFSVQPKREKTGDSKALVPMPASGNSPDGLLDALKEIESWYVANRQLVEKYGRKS